MDARPYAPCSVEDCGKPVDARGFCSNHWYRWKKHGSPTAGRPFGTVGCVVAGCSNPHLAQGYCNLHYKRWKTYGDPAVRKIATSAQIASFIEKALQHQTNDCLLWPYGQTNGYGVTRYNGRKIEAYVLICGLAHGAKPAAGYETAHGCNVKLCVNPRHLRWDTRAGNAKDSAGEIHWNAKLTNQQVQDIRSRPSEKTMALSREFGVSYGTIYAIRKRHIWKHRP
jgi:hypothetical protein